MIETGAGSLPSSSASGMAEQPQPRKHFFGVRDRPGLLGRKFFPDQLVAAAAVAAASLPGGEGLRQDLADHGYDVDALLVPAPDPELNHSALEALLVAAGRDGPCAAQGLGG